MTWWWEMVVQHLEREGWHFEKMYRVEITPEETIVWHDQYDEAGNPVMDRRRDMPVVTRTRIENAD